jgi:hypothetical protein
VLRRTPGPAAQVGQVGEEAIGAATEMRIGLASGIVNTDTINQY